jgi:hypothetical protein
MDDLIDYLEAEIADNPRFDLDPGLGQRPRAFLAARRRRCASGVADAVEDAEVRPPGA